MMLILLYEAGCVGLLNILENKKMKSEEIKYLVWDDTFMKWKIQVSWT